MSREAALARQLLDRLVVDRLDVVRDRVAQQVGDVDADAVLPGVHSDDRRRPSPQRVAARGAALHVVARRTLIRELLDPAELDQVVADGDDGRAGEAGALDQIGGGQRLPAPGALQYLEGVAAPLERERVLGHRFRLPS